MSMIPAQMQIPGLDLSASLHNTATEVLCLMNMVEIEELMDDEEYEGTERLSTKTVTSSCIKVSAERLTCWALSFSPVRNQMERIISVRSDWNIWYHLWR